MNSISDVQQIERFEHVYLRISWAMFPLKFGEKVPATMHGLNDATMDETEYRALCNGPHGIGLATGERSKLWVLDVDVRHRGDKSIHQLIEQYGPLPFTVQSRTQGGGQHIFFKWDSARPITNRTNFLPGLDVRASGGYVVVPPSRGPQGTYEWINPPIRTPVADAPDWLYQLLKADKPQGPKDLSHLAAGVTDGSRNVSMTSLLGTLLGRGVDVKLAWALADAYNQVYVFPPLDDDEFQKTFESIASRELAKRERRLRGRSA